MAGVADDDGLHARVHVLAENPRQPGRFHGGGSNKATCATCPSKPLYHILLQRFSMSPRAICGFANAGHNPPILLRASGEAQMLEGGGPVLGVISIAPTAKRAATSVRRLAGAL